MHTWRYVAHVMGAPAELAFTNEEEATHLFTVASEIEPAPGPDNILMANALIHSAPLLLGAGPDERKKLTKQVYQLARTLLGDEGSDQLNFPKVSTFGVLADIRFRSFLNRTLDKFSRSLRSKVAFNQYSDLMRISAGGGLGYELPDHVYAERANRW